MYFFSPVLRILVYAYNNLMHVININKKIYFMSYTICWILIYFCENPSIYLLIYNIPMNQARDLYMTNCCWQPRDPSVVHINESDRRHRMPLNHGYCHQASRSMPWPAPSWFVPCLQISPTAGRGKLGGRAFCFLFK